MAVILIRRTLVNDPFEVITFAASPACVGVWLVAALYVLSLSLSLILTLLHPTIGRLDRCSVSSLLEKRRDALYSPGSRAHVQPISARTCRVAATPVLVGVRNVLVTLEERLERLSERREFAVAGSVSWRRR